jgi:hypothetical protein
MAKREGAGTIQRSPMERFAKSYSEALLHTRTEIQLQPAGSNRRYNVEVIGVHDATRMVIVSAPANADRSLIAVHQDQIVTCRWMNATTVFRFDASIARLVFDPLPMLHLNELHSIQFRELRQVPRARSAIAAALRTPVPMAALVTDLSVTGARVGVSSAVPLDAGQDVDLAVRVQLFNRDFTLTLGCRINSDLGELDADHPDIRFYGLQFTRTNDADMLAVHGMVQQQLALEADRLGHLLQAEATQSTRLTQILPMPNFPPREDL